MATPTPQQIANYAQTTLASACTSSATTLTLTSVSGLPTSGNFMLRIDDPAPATTFEYIEVASVNVGASQVTTSTNGPTANGRGMENTTGIAHSAGAIVGNDLTAAMIQRAVSLGYVGYNETTTSSAAFTTLTDILTVTVTTLAGRRYRIAGHVRAFSSVSGDVINCFLYEDATQIQDSLGESLGGTGSSYAPWVHRTPTAGSHTYKISMSRQGGTGNITAFAGVGNPICIEVVDVGPA